MSGTTGSAENALLFERLVLPHLDAAYNQARWLLQDEHDAQDVVQEAMLRALRYMGTCRSEEAKSWLLQIVRNCCFSWLKENRPKDRTFGSGDVDPWDDIAAPAEGEPHTAAIRNATRLSVNKAISALPVGYRDVLVLREFEELSYAEIATITGCPIGTVMSRLARARAALRRILTAQDAPFSPTPISLHDRNPIAFGESRDADSPDEQPLPATTRTTL
jgi:RNA polymerase sigma-70 factor, ECF subfamily